MRCEELAAAGFGAFDDETRPASATAAMTAHLASCAACRAEAVALATLGRQLEREGAAAAMPSAATGLAEDGGGRRFAQLLEAWRIGRDERRTWRNVLPLAATLLIGIALGSGSPWRLGGGSSGSGGSPTPALQRQFLLALRERPGSIGGDAADMRRIVAEYGEWAETLARADRLVAAEKLRDDADLLLRRNASGQGVAIASSGADAALEHDERLSGYFVVRARDLDDAVEIARGSPHLRLGGTIALREIERTP